MAALIVIIDGCNVEYINKQTTPFLHNLKEKGGFAEISVTPSFANRVEIMSGSSPITTDTFVDFCYNPPKFSLTPFFSDLKLKDRNFLTRKFISILHRFIYGSGLDVVNIPAPFLNWFSLNDSLIKFQEEEKKRSKKHFFGILESMGFHVKFIYGKTEIIRHKIMKIDVGKNDVLMLHFGDTDTLGHKYGPNSWQVVKSLNSISSLLEGFYNSQKFDFIAIFGDHNMVEVHKIVDLWKDLMKLDIKPIEDYMFFLNSPMARFWFKNESAKKEIINFLESLDYGHIITRDELRLLELPADDKYGELIFWLKEGFHICPDFYHSSKLKGMHGYIDKVYKTPFIISHKNFNVNLKNGKLKDIAPTLLDLLGISQEVMEGESLLV